MSDEDLCHKEIAPEGPSLLQDGNLVFQAHHVGWIIASFFTGVACIASFWLVNKHLQWYTNKREQRYIVRILFLVPLYALISIASYFFWNHATPLILVRDCYESIVLTAFFYLLLLYLSPDPDEQKAIFAQYGISKEADQQAILKGKKVKKWVWPLGPVKWKPSNGLVFLQMMKWGVLQYCVIRPLCTLAAVILDYAGLYCETSWGLGWGHIYIIIIISLSVTVAMYCLIQLYIFVADILRPQKPLLKLFAIKAVVFLTFWQATFLSLLSMFGVVKDSTYMTAEDINIGIGALLETFEMTIFAFLHIRCFSYKPYRPVHSTDEPPPKRTPRLGSLGHAMDFRETFREIWAGSVYMWHKMRGKEPVADLGAKRHAAYEEAFGRARSGFVVPEEKPKDKKADRTSADLELEKLTMPIVQVEIEERVDVGGSRQRLGGDSDYGYGVHRERSEGLEVQIERELERRGYGSNILGWGHIKPLSTQDGAAADHRKQRSWWRSIYQRVSQSEQETHPEENAILSRGASPSRKSKSRSRHRIRDSDTKVALLPHQQYEMDDPPPPNLIRQHRNHRSGDLSTSRTSHTMAKPPDIRANRPSKNSTNRERRDSREHRSASKGNPTSKPRASPHEPQPLLPFKSLLSSPKSANGNIAHISADSLLDRVFLHAEYSAGHGYIAPQSSSSLVHGNQIGMAGERSMLRAHVHSGLLQKSHEGEIVDEERSNEAHGGKGRHGTHHRESAFHQSRLNTLDSVDDRPAMAGTSFPASKTPVFDITSSNHAFNASGVGAAQDSPRLYGQATTFFSR